MLKSWSRQAKTRRQSGGADVEPEQNENQAGMKYEAVMSETGVDPRLLALRSNVRRRPRIGAGHLGLTFVVYTEFVCLMVIATLAKVNWHRYEQDIAVLATVCVLLIVVCLALSAWHQGQERSERPRAENQIESDNEFSDARHQGS